MLPMWRKTPFDHSVANTPAGTIMLTLRRTSKKRTHIAVTIVALCWLSLAAASASAQQQLYQQPQQKTGFQLREYKDVAGSHKYSVFIPHGYSTRYKWP